MTLFSRSRKLTSAAILAIVMAGDGPGSGLDADLLDGQHGSYYRDAGNINAGTLAVARGGTGLASYTAGDILYATGTTTLSKLAIGTNGHFLKVVAGLPAYAAITVSDIASGVLAAANGGTGVANAGTFTNASNTTITGGGTIALAGFTLTVPAIGTAALLGIANAFTAAQTITPGTTSSALTLAGGTVTDSYPTISSTQTWNDAADAFKAAVFSVTVTNASSGSRILDCLAGGVSKGSIDHLGNYRGNRGFFSDANTQMNLSDGTNQTSFQTAGVTHYVNVNELHSGGQIIYRVSSSYTNVLTISGTAATLVPPLTISNSTAATSTSTGSLINTGGFGCGGAGYFAGNLTAGGNPDPFSRAPGRALGVTSSSGNAGLYVNAPTGSAAETIWGVNATRYGQLACTNASFVISGFNSVPVSLGYGGTAYWSVDTSGNFQQATDGANMIFGTGTGVKFGTATGQKMGWWNATPVVKGTVTGSRGGNAALASLLTLLASYGLLTDSSS